MSVIKAYSDFSTEIPTTAITTEIIDLINDYGRNRGKYQKGSNKNPITGTGGKAKKPNESRDTEAEEENL